MRRNLHFFWPRAESNLYAEPKRLVEAGYARSRQEPVGRRRRTVYSIAPKGRRALDRWLAEPAGESRLEAEALIKILFSPRGRKDTLLAHLGRVLAEAEARRQVLRGIFDEYLRGDDPFPERVQINVLCYRLIWESASTTASWAQSAIREVEGWHDVAVPDDRATSIETLRRLIA